MSQILLKNEKVNLILSDVQDQYVELDYNYILDLELYYTLIIIKIELENIKFQGFCRYRTCLERNTLVITQIHHKIRFATAQEPNTPFHK